MDTALSREGLSSFLSAHSSNSASLMAWRCMNACGTFYQTKTFDALWNKKKKKEDSGLLCSYNLISDNSGTTFLS